MITIIKIYMRLHVTIRFIGSFCYGRIVNLETIIVSKIIGILLIIFTSNYVFFSILVLI